MKSQQTLPLNSNALFILLIAAILATSTSGAQAQRLRRHLPQGAYGKPNIVLLTADNFTYQDFENIRKSQSDFPNLNKIITNGIVFTRFYNSGFKPEEVYYSYIFGFNAEILKPGNSNNLNVNNLCIAQVLKENDYFSGILGKWLLGEEVNLPSKKGFHEWFGFLTRDEATNLYPAYIWRNDSKFFLAANRNGARGVSAQHWFNITTTNFLRIYREYLFFLYLPAILPGKINAESNSQGILNKGITLKNTAKRFNQLKELDSYTGIILDYMKTFKISDKTLIIFTGTLDAEEQIKKLTENKQPGGLKEIVEIIEDKLHVPLVVYKEGMPASTNNSLLTSYDIYPTIIQLADGKLERNVYSNAFTDLIFNKTNQIKREFLLWKTENLNYNWIVRFNGFFAGHSIDKNEIQIQPIDNEKFENFSTNEVEKQVVEFLKRAIKQTEN